METFNCLLFNGSVKELVDTHFAKKYATYTQGFYEVGGPAAKPVRLFLHELSVEVAYYALLFKLFECIDKWTNLCVQIGNKTNTYTLRFDCIHMIDGRIIRTLDSHAKLLVVLTQFNSPTDGVQKLHLNIVGYNMILTKHESSGSSEKSK